MPRKIDKPASPRPVTAVRHSKDHRVNIPTAELESFSRDDERSPKTVLYPRDPSLDPQLVWKGKDEQDRSDLAVPAVPIYIQEQIDPRAIIEDLRSESATRRDEQLDLFSDFNGIPFDQRVDFYRHQLHWTNRMILGDSLLVMASLAEKEGLKGQVQCIYIDPPYGIKFGSNWQVSTRKRDVKDGKAEDTTRQPEQVRAFRDTWELGIHSYLTYLRDRLVVARDLLTESGSVFVQIGDENVHLVRSLLDEVFGAQNFVAFITFKKTAGLGTDSIPAVSDYVLWYARERDRVKIRPLYRPKVFTPDDAYSWFEGPDGTRRKVQGGERTASSADGRLLRYQILLAAGRTESCIYPIEFEGATYWPTAGRSWATNKSGMERLIWADRVAQTGTTLSYVRYADDFPVNPIQNFWDDTASGSAMDKVYVVQTSAKVIERSLLLATDPGDLVLDPTCGSGTTAYASEQWGRRWITIDTSRVALALARTRLMAARYPFYMLADSTEGRRKTAELTGQVPLGGPTEGDIRQGFVCEHVPHVTLRSIAQNPEIQEGMSRQQIDAAIARHSDSETLYDRPYEDAKVVRVAGPFSVESLSPHRVVADGPEDQGVTTAPIEESGRFVATILDNLRASGVDNRVKGERLRFETLEPYPGTWLQAEGTYPEGDVQKRAAVALGPEFGTVGAELVREAAKEAVRAGFDLLIICGFAFEAMVDEQARSLGRLTILRANMNPDLRMAEDLLKKTRSGNLFTVFGEPDVTLSDAPDGQLVVEIRGLDVYDPTTGEVRSDSTKDIACWFIDTNYNAESFFVRHAYFCGDDEPYEKLKRALRAEIDEAAWSSLYSCKSRPFPRPKTGRIAVKVINHYGDEVMKVYHV